MPIASHQHSEYYKALDTILRKYNAAGFTITVIECNREYEVMMDVMKDELHVTMNYTNAQDHVPKAERNNCMLKERIRMAFHHLPYKAIPQVMIRYLAMESARKLNLFPAKGGISAYYSPQTILTHEVLNYNKHCTKPFGMYVQASQENDPTNMNVERMLDAIYLKPNTNKQSSHILMDLHTGEAIT